MAGLKFFALVEEDNRLFITGGMGGTPPLAKYSLMPLPPGKVPPSRLPVPNLDKKCIGLSDSAQFYEK